MLAVCEPIWGARVRRRFRRSFANTAPGDTTARYSQVSAVCTYQMQWLPKLPFYSNASTVSITGTTAFLNFW